ncbi:creatininase family protein [Amycolatopsis sp. FDAARGOS 1241]|uniref:creatininase family protein n=1 Tax=Amycolatopsis sp. FDAARGOS 1241 TaxID=2778070 RepID=UPI001EF3A540|nr:creatininase family protein [Amycolatopsis sp. FDAARGOS 1241]
MEESRKAADVAVLPVGSYEQHGPHLPLSTDSAIAHIIADRLASEYGLLQLPPITVGCSHEHEGLHVGTVSVSARTLYGVIVDIHESLRRSGIEKLIVISGHGGNYVLMNVIQELNVNQRRVLFFPERESVETARRRSGCVTTASEDMHAGEWETSILLGVAPELVRDGWQDADHEANSRPDLLTTGLKAYTTSGVIGRPSAATAAKGVAILDSLADSFAARLEVLRA